MNRFSRRHVRPTLEGLEGRQLLSMGARGYLLTQSLPLTSSESGNFSVQVERRSPLIERFDFNGSGMIPDLGTARVHGSAIVKENQAQAGTVSGTLIVTLSGHGGTAMAHISEQIPAHTGSSPLLPFNYSFSGGTGVFRHGFDSGTGTLVRNTAIQSQHGATGTFTVFVFSNHYSGLVAFGDSLTDIGNRYAATGGTDPTSPPYDAGRWSDGPLWVEHLAAGLGLPAPMPSALGGTDFAAADAGTALSGYAHNGSANIGTQITSYLAANSKIDSDQLFVIWGGTNDFSPRSTPNPAKTVANLTAEITELAHAGAKQFLIPNLMPLGQVPGIKKLGPDQVARYDALSAQFNTLLAAAEGQLEATLDVKIHQLDVFGLMESVLTNPSNYGITDVTDQAKSGDEGDPGVVVSNPDGFLFWDNIHPTETFERLLGNQAIQAATH